MTTGEKEAMDCMLLGDARADVRFYILGSVAVRWQGQEKERSKRCCHSLFSFFFWEIIFGRK